MVNGYLYLLIGANLPFLNTENLQLPQTKNETPATVEPNATLATVEHDPTASTPTQFNLHVLVAKFIFQLGIDDTGRGAQTCLKNKLWRSINDAAPAEF
ncbi:hypothetical protein TNCV_839061 [Trichonephila clavipes]|nr:hypothetical protein TNCV_839061 [Trichonephila clavipes]